MKSMRKALNPLVAGCLLYAIGVAPETLGEWGRVTGMTTRVEAAPTLATVTGTVKDESGKPLIGAIVALLEPHSRGRELQSVRTDLKGRFTAAVAPGAYRLRATAEGFSSMLTRINLDRSGRLTYDIALRRSNTLVHKRGDSDDYRWIARSVPRHVLNLRPNIPVSRPAGESDEVRTDSFTRRQPTFHGVAQFLATQSAIPRVGPDFFGLNFAVSGSLDGNIEVALIGQRGTGQLAPQRMMALTSMRTSDRHKITASIGYGQTVIGNTRGSERNLALGEGRGVGRRETLTLDQLSVTALGEWQVAAPLLLIYGFDYSSFIGSAARQQESILPRMALQYTPRSDLRLNAAVTPGRLSGPQTVEEFRTENTRTRLDLAAPEVAFQNSPQLDRSRRYETGFEKIFGAGNSAVEVSAFYDLISGHGVGVMALPLAASPRMEATFQQIAHQVTAMNGAARGTRIVYRQNLGGRVTAALGYSAGGGTQFRPSFAENLKPGQIFRNGLFQVATAKLDLDLADQTGTRISTVIRLSPSAVVFAIDPFAGRMSVYDPNINIYVTQELPSFGLPVQWEAIVDLRNLLNQTTTIDDGPIQLLATRNSRTIRGGLAFRW
jgi:hypothetical protein